jgi:hypothetical protein
MAGDATSHGPRWTHAGASHYSPADESPADDLPENRVSTILLLVIALLAPWVVHLAAPRQRALALVGVIVVFLLYGIFAENPLLKWELWAGLAAGILTVLFLAGGAVSSGRPRSSGSRRPPRDSGFDDPNEPTGEI